MLSTDLPLESRLPELPYGSVWLIGGGGSDRRYLSPLAVHALSTADAIIHDPGIVQEILDLVKPPRYREVASAGRAIERVIKLAEDGWRVVQLVKGDAMQRAVESATRCAERNVPFRIVPNAGAPLGCEAPLGLLMVRQPMSVEGADPQPTLVLLVAAPHSDIAAGMAPRQRPLDFSMSGLAG
jgi:uroporphyrin-III C-methyltransferase